jgi:hypothetical protein
MIIGMAILFCITQQRAALRYGIVRGGLGGLPSQILDQLVERLPRTRKMKLGEGGGVITNYRRKKIDGSWWWLAVS